MTTTISPSPARGLTVYHPTSVPSGIVIEHSKPNTKGPAWLGYLVLILFGGGFAAWSTLAPLAGGALATGVIAPEGHHKTIQHLEGGIIRELRVREGDTVQEGQTLVVLEQVQSRADVDTLATQRLSLLAKNARVEAQRSGQEQITFPPELTTGTGLHELAVSQQQIFDSQRASHAARVSVLTQKVEQLKTQITGAKAQIVSLDQQLEFVEAEVGGKEDLFRKGLLAKPELLRLQRTRAELYGRRGELTAEVARLEQQATETGFQLAGLEAERQDGINTEAEKIRADLLDIKEKLRTSEDVLKRTIIAAPVSGKIFNLRFATLGGVVQRGEPILDIVPQQDNLVIDAHVPVNDIDVVHPGLTAQVSFPAYSRRTAPRLSGVVTTVAADRTTPGGGGAPYYLARVEVSAPELKERAPNVKLVSGMSAEVMIVVEQRTFLDYLLKPIKDILRRGLHEV